MLQALYDNFVESLTAKMTDISATMSAELTAPLTAAMTIYLILYGWAIIRGSVQEPLLDFTLRGVKLAIIWTLVSSAGDYSAWVGDTILNDIPDFVELLAGGSTNLPSDAVMAMAGQISVKVQEQYGSGLAGTMYGYALSVVLILIAVPFAALAFVSSLLVHFGLTLLAAIGPLFVAFALFEVTRGWFFAWLGQAMNFSILKLLVIVLMMTVTAFIGDVYASFNIEEAAASISAFLVAMACGTIFFFLLPSIASALSAGTSASTGAAQRMVERKLFGTSPRAHGPGSSSGSATRTD
ncbi:type IV secretion system protein [Salipiger mangrovisoli]|uniref:Type IV secretion system protein n=1 Tax=Salipiger mangrovisoli TaxID=2865933 RepID=A0ABR9X8K7_9RHOB|nr:type IV secretion system protein [Salipiger mangrovisoli]MBE9639824.1 type IV secretion system protein [Salipiger mangrovisoli]